ncbi:unnamed protein product [Citrullus colocynthis]|uniref:Thioredoxin domain-containing protein n=1 Tax=Citrullus colocynthis TaxID=252529 RepID=A0ABP0YPG3_9ROSI
MSYALEPKGILFHSFYVVILSINAIAYALKYIAAKAIDCVRAEPVIYKKLEAASDDIALLRAYVGDRPTWRNPQHPWRVDSRFKLTGVPTLVRWDENDKISGRLEDHEAHLENKLDALIAGK